MKKKYWVIVLIIIFIIGGIIFYKKGFKNNKKGNNISSQDIVTNILNLSSYETKVTITIKSNKNINKYVLIQKSDGTNNIQEVLEPSNIAGVKITNDGKNLKIENSNLGLSSIIENYAYLGNNCLDLSTFIEDYKSNESSTFEENEKEILMKTNSRIDNIYMKDKILHIDKESGNPVEMIIKDNSQKDMIYILYNEVKINM